MKNNNESYRGNILVINDEPNLGDPLAKRPKNIRRHQEFINDYEEAAMLTIASTVSDVFDLIMGDECPTSMERCMKQYPYLFIR